MLRVRLTKRLDRFALDLELACPAGSILAITGPSGSGKTTLLRLLAGLDKPDDGRIELNGEAWLDTGTGLFHKARQRTIGLVFQEYSLFPHMTLSQNIAYATDDRAWARELLESFGIAHLAGSRPGRLSGGERQRGALCQALARRPKLLLLDEPFSALDAATRRALRLELLRVRDRFRLPIIHVTHDLAEAAQLGDAVLALVDGRLNPDWFPLQVAQRLDEEAVLLARAREPIFSQPHQPQGAPL